jgi:hypothetical protein
VGDTKVVSNHSRAGGENRSRATSPGYAAGVTLTPAPSGAGRRRRPGTAPEAEPSGASRRTQGLPD